MLVVKGKIKKFLYGYIIIDVFEILCGFLMIVFVWMRSWESNGLKMYFFLILGMNVLIFYF